MALYRKVTIGGYEFTDAAQPGVKFSQQKMSGWDGATASTKQLQQKPRAGGAFKGNTPQRTARTITWGFQLHASSVAAMSAALDEINAAVGLDDVPMVVEVDGASRWAPVSQQDEPAIEEVHPLLKRISLQLSSAESRKFGQELTASTALPSSTGGLQIPFTVPFTIDATTVSGLVALTNPGNATGPVRLRINGPVTGPVVTHVGSGLALVFSSSIALGVGEWIDVDMEAQTVLAQGQSSRSGWVVQRDWSGFEEGPNVWAFSAVGYDPAASLQVFATPAWL